MDGHRAQTGACKGPVTKRIPPLDPQLLLRAYSVGVFPMADSADAPSVYWVEPKERAVLPLDGFHLSRSLKKTLLSERFKTTANQAFGEIVELCAESVGNRPETWINHQIAHAVDELHTAGHAHSIETWLDGKLVGGLYGISLGNAFFGESMVSRATDASKVALAHLVARLKIGGFRLLDCQFMTDHLHSLGAVEISRDAYMALLGAAIGGTGSGSSAGLSAGADFRAFDFPPSPAPSPESTTVFGPTSGWRIVQALTHTS
ncbi:leucyl/phenylalanyl-tRNA--protein transferase [Sphingomonas paeninsulae]|uniref:Leucyl/phenylalanyl-tRNA--protein transferase n=1 Tax=Sphingomonas paeninsulae TaxID=2319844 RepID=A0A494TQD5_SPHPE|nr:leucyl/phenylalanyl-tRNA--protein transferase [Sphingomonas paeninsulae]